MSHNDTIVAQATPPGRGGVGILRISGLKARDVAQAVLGKLPKPRYADYLPFKDSDGSALDQGIALWFPGPNSFTGEDVLELQGHGGPVILDLLLKRILTLPGVRIARPGRSHCRPDRRQLRAGGAFCAEFAAGRILHSRKPSCGSADAPAHLRGSGH